MDYHQSDFFQKKQFSYGKDYQPLRYPGENAFLEEAEYERDMERMKTLYPKTARQVQRLVEEECDKMEYDGSLMYDEYPDRIMLRRICRNIYHNLDEFCKENDKSCNNLIEVLLYNEIYKRRCRRHRCRRWW